MSGIWTVVRESPDYPESLRSIPSPPARLWVCGTLPPLEVVAVVGTRRPSAFGRRVADAVARTAVAAGLGVVAGLATGVDTVAHRAALDAGGRTWAVLGSGVDVPTPWSNRVLAAEIVETGGGLVAEVPPGTDRSARQLVARDRIQAGLSCAVVICQCEVGSGAMHTARFALVQRRPLVVARPAPSEAALPASSGNLALCDPAGCEPALLGATGRVAAALAGRRPMADVVVTARGELPGLWAGLAAARASPVTPARSPGCAPPSRSSPAAPARPRGEATQP